MNYRIAKRINPLNTDEARYYAAPCYAEELGVQDLAADISDACSLHITDVKAVLSVLMVRLPWYLKKGFKIQLGELGRMKLSFSSKGAASPEMVDETYITSRRILYTPSPAMKESLKRISFSRADLAGEPRS